MVQFSWDGGGIVFPLPIIMFQRRHDLRSSQSVSRDNSDAFSGEDIITSQCANPLPVGQLIGHEIKARYRVHPLPGAALVVILAHVGGAATRKSAIALTRLGKSPADRPTAMLMDNPRMATLNKEKADNYLRKRNFSSVARHDVDITDLRAATIVDENIRNPGSLGLANILEI